MDGWICDYSIYCCDCVVPLPCAKAKVAIAMAVPGNSFFLSISLCQCPKTSKIGCFCTLTQFFSLLSTWISGSCLLLLHFTYV